MRTGNRLGQLIKQRFLYLGKLCRVHDLKNVFYLIEEHDFFRTVDLRPISEETQYHLILLVLVRERAIDITYLLGQSRVLFQKLHYTIRQLGMVHAEALHLVQWDQHTGKEKLVFFFQWQSETVDDGPQNLEQFGDAVEPFGFVNELEKHIVY